MMLIVYIIIVGLPAVLIFYCISKIVQCRKISTTGVATNGWVTQVDKFRSHRAVLEKVSLEYADVATGLRYPATTTAGIGTYKQGDLIPVTYLGQEPQKYSFDKGQGYWGLLVFSIVLFLFMIFASFKINELVQASNFHFG